jgi:predicted nucleic acid-binding protein
MGFARVKLSDALHDVTVLGIETAPFIYFVEKNPRYVDLMRTVFARADAGDLRIITSIITLTEVLVLPIERGYEAYQREYRQMLLSTKSIRAEMVNASVAERAAALRAAYRLRTPDALHLATALIHQCDAFLTNDRALQRVSEIRVLVLDSLQTG